MEGGDRSLSRKKSSASSEAGSACDLIRAGKRTAEDGACDLNGKEESASATTAEILGMKKEDEEAPDLIRSGKRTAEDGACDDGKEEVVLAATAEVIRTKKKEVLDLLRARKRMYEEEAKPAGTAAGTEERRMEYEKKRKKVVKPMFPQAAIDLLMTPRPVVAEVPDDELAEYPQRYRDIVLISRAIKNKTLEYDQAIIDQYLQLGYAVDEKEVTDDEDENETVEN